MLYFKRAEIQESPCFLRAKLNSSLDNVVYIEMMIFCKLHSINRILKF